MFSSSYKAAKLPQRRNQSNKSLKIFSCIADWLCLTAVACSISKVIRDCFSKRDVLWQLWSAIFHPDRNTQTLAVIFLQHPLRAQLTLFPRAWRKRSSCLLVCASPNCTCSRSSCCLRFKKWVPRAVLEAFLTSSSDADHITCVKTEVWPWHLCKRVWLGCFLIRGWKRNLPNSGGCLWRGTFIKVAIQSCVLLSARCFLITD